MSPAWLAENTQLDMRGRDQVTRGLGGNMEELALIVQTHGATGGAQGAEDMASMQPSGHPMSQGGPCRLESQMHWCGVLLGF